MIAFEFSPVYQTLMSVIEIYLDLSTTELFKVKTFSHAAATPPTRRGVAAYDEEWSVDAGHAAYELRARKRPFKATIKHLTPAILRLLLPHHGATLGKSLPVLNYRGNVSEIRPHCDIHIAIADMNANCSHTQVLWSAGGFACTLVDCSSSSNNNISNNKKHNLWCDTPAAAVFFHQSKYQHRIPISVRISFRN